MSERRKQDVERVPLSSIAPDARDLIQAYRESGEISFQDVPLATARENYLRGCEANGLPRADCAVVRDHEVPVPGATLRVREYRRDASGKPPAVLFMHGGGWVIGNLDTHDAICRTLARESGAAVYAVDYRLAPEHPFPTPLDDCAAALRWLVDHAASLDVDVSRLGLAGDSAGGNLAAVLANTQALLPRACIVRAQVLFYPVTDLRGETASYQRIVAGFPLTANSMHWFRDHYLRPGTSLDDTRFPRFFSASFSTPGAAPVQRFPVPAELRAGSPGGRGRGVRRASHRGRRACRTSPPASARAWHHHVGGPYRYRARHADPGRRVPA